MTGNLVRTFDQDAVRFNTVVWDGTDQQGRNLPLGMYLVSMTAGEQKITRRTMLVR